MIILSIDPAKATGLSLWETPNTPKTKLVNVQNPCDIGGAIITLRAFAGGTSPDYVIMERPFFPRPRKNHDDTKYVRNLKAYELHLSILQYWQCAIFDLWGLHMILEKKGGINSKSRGRLVWPATWQSVIFEGIKIAGSKAKSALAARQKFEDLSTALSYDEYDAINIGVYQWLMCRDLGIRDTTATQQRILDLARASGAALPTAEELSQWR